MPWPVAGMWPRVASAAGVIAAMATVVILLWGGSLLARDPETSPAISSESVVSTASTGHTSDSSLATTPLARGPFPDCVDGDGAVIECTASGAGLVLAMSPCSVDGARRALGVPTDLLLDISVRSSKVSPAPGGTLPHQEAVCVATPGPLATTQKASPAQLRDLPDTLAAGSRPPSALVLCASDDGADVSCAAPHRVEPVTGWVVDDGKNLTESCTENARSYAQRPLGIADPLVAEVQRGMREGRPVTRCVLRSSVLLRGTAYHLGGAELPTRATS